MCTCQNVLHTADTAVRLFAWLFKAGLCRPPEDSAGDDATGPLQDDVEGTGMGSGEGAPPPPDAAVHASAVTALVLCVV